MIFFSFALCSARVPLMKHKWGVIGFWRAAKRTAEASGVGRSSRLPPPTPPPPEKWRRVVQTPGVSAGRGSALGNSTSTWGRKRPCRPGGMHAALWREQRVCVWARAYMETRYTSHGESAVSILSHHPPFCRQQTNKKTNMEQAAEISEESMFFMNNEIPAPKNTSTPNQTNMYICQK